MSTVFTESLVHLLFVSLSPRYLVVCGHTVLIFLNYDHWMEVLGYHHLVSVCTLMTSKVAHHFMCINQWSSFVKCLLISLGHVSISGCLFLVYLKGFLYVFWIFRVSMLRIPSSALLLPSPLLMSIVTTTTPCVHCRNIDLPMQENNVFVMNSLYFMDNFRDF